MGEALTIEVRQGHDYAIVTAAGEIDIYTVTRLRERLFEVAASGHPVVVDFDQVGFIDSVGLAVLVGTANRAAAHGSSLQVACARPQIRQLLRLTGLDRRIVLTRTLDEALEARAAVPGMSGRGRADAGLPGQTFRFNVQGGRASTLLAPDPAEASRRHAGQAVSGAPGGQPAPAARSG